MALPPEYRGIDFSKYGTWEKVVSAIDGKTYYKIPGKDVYFDPTRGRNGTITNTPERVIEQKKNADKAINPQPGIGGQLAQTLVPIAGTAGGIIAANQIANIGTASTAPTGAGILSTGSAAAPATTAAPAVASNVAPAASTAAPIATTAAPAATTSSAAFPVGTAADGGTLMSDGTTAAASSGSSWTTAPANGSLGQIAGGIATGVGAYNTAKGLDNGGEGVRAGTTQMFGGIGSMLGGVGGGAIGAAYGNALGYGLQGDGWKNKAVLAATNPNLFVASMFGFSPIRKTTKQYQQERWGDLAKNKIEGAEAAYQANHPDGDTGVWADGKYAGQKWTFEKALDLATTDPVHFHQVYGNYKTFGNDWNKYTPEQKSKIISGLIQNNLYESKKGDVLIKDEEAAKKVRDQVLAGQLPAAQQPAAAQPQPRVTAAPQPVAQQPAQPQPNMNQRNITIGGNQFTPAQQQQAAQNLQPQNAGMLSIPNYQTAPSATPPIIPPQQPMVNYGQNLGILSTPITGQPRVGGIPGQQPAMSQQQMQQLPIIQMPQQQVPQTQPVTTPVTPVTTSVQPAPQPKVSGAPAVAQNAKKSQEEIIAELNKPNVLAGLFKKATPVPEYMK